MIWIEKPNSLEPTCDISMNYGAFTNDSLTTMYEVVRGALDADDTLKARDEEIRFRVRETAEWKKHAADLEMEMIKRGMMFEVINLVPRSGRASLIGWTERLHGVVTTLPDQQPFSASTTAADLLGETRSSPRHWTSSGLCASERHRQCRKSCT